MGILEAVGDAEVEAEPEEPDTTTNVLCVGPPISGKTTQANLISQRYGAKLFDLHAYIKELLESDRPWG